MRPGSLLAMAALLVCGGGCARLASVATGRLMVQAPNQIDPRIRTANRRPIGEPGDGVDERFWVSVGPPRASLLVSVVEPRWTTDLKDREFHHEVSRPMGADSCNVVGAPHWLAALPPCEQAEHADGSKGTVLFLHGAYSRTEHMLPIAKRVAAEGFRCVLVDLRGHGRSTGERITYGVQESADLGQVIDVLGQKGLIEGGLGVYGFSFGAATAIQLAGRDPRVGAVVAVAAFSRLHDAVGEAAQSRLPGAARYVDARWVEETLREAGREGAFDTRAADAVAAIERTRAMVLLVHGDADEFVQAKHSVALHRAGWRHSQIVLVKGADHADVARDERGTVTRLAVDWFGRWLPALSGSEEEQAPAEVADPPAPVEMSWHRGRSLDTLTREGLCSSMLASRVRTGGRFGCQT